MMSNKEETLPRRQSPREKENAVRQIGIALTALFALAAAVLFTATLLTVGLGVLADGDSPLGGMFRSHLPTIAWQETKKDERDTRETVDEPAEGPDDELPDEELPGTNELTDGKKKITPRDFSITAAPTVKNKTSYKLDTDALLAMSSDVETPEEIYAQYGKTAPIVLIIHTHGTECYRAEEQTESDAGDHFRSDDPLRNIVSVGDVLAEVLVNAGINTMHCTVMFDKESYNEAYTESGETVKELVAKYPSIRYVIDVHRDALSDNEKNYAAVTEIDGVSYAQFLMVIGTDEGGAKHPRWKECLSAAMKLQVALAEDYPSVVRSISLRRPSFNAQNAPISLLFEFGTCANTLREAKRTAVLVGEKLAELISGKPCLVNTDVILARFA